MNNNILERVEHVPMTNFSSVDILYMLKELPDACCIFKVLINDSGNVKDMLFLYANEKYGQLVGKRSAELIGCPYFEVVNNRDEDWLSYSYQAAILRKSIMERTYNSSFKKWFEFWAVPVYQSGYCAFIIHDVTPMSKNEEHMKFSLNSDNLSLKCLNLIMNSPNNNSINLMLENLGNAFGAERLYIINKVNQIYEKYDYISEIAKEYPSENEFIKYNVLNIWNKQFNNENFILCNDSSVIEKISKPVYDAIYKNYIHRYAVVKILDKDKILGYLVVENYDKNIQLDIINILQAIALCIASYFKNRILSEEKIFAQNHDSVTTLPNQKMFGQKFTFLSELSINIGACYIKLNRELLLDNKKDFNINENKLKDQVMKMIAAFGKENCYRIRELDFIIMFPEISQKDFEEKFNLAISTFKDVSVFINGDWDENSKHIGKIFKK